MDKTEENRRCKWSVAATNLLISIWSHDLVQNQLKLSSRNQPIWESIARHMTRKGFEVTALQCRTRVKNMLCSYYEAVRKKNRKLIEPYFDIFDKVVYNRNKKKKGCGKTTCKSTKQNSAICEENDAEDGTQLDISFSSVGQSVIQVGQSASDNCDQWQSPDIDNQMIDISSQLLKKNKSIDIDKIVTKAIVTQTEFLSNVLSEALKCQSDIIEKLFVSERKKLEVKLSNEKDEFDLKLERLEAKLQANGAYLRCLNALIKSQINKEQ